MPVFELDDAIVFPPVHLAAPDGLLAVGGGLPVQRLFEAYRLGIFPWYNEPPILWWCPNPMFVLFPEEIKVAKSLKPLLHRNAFDFTVNKAFENVAMQCKNIERSGQDGTWIGDDVLAAYNRLHEAGYAHSAEVWQDDQLVGGLYGVKMGKVFFGESMFSLVPNASKYAFVKYVRQLVTEGVALIDCQVHTSYLESFGARMVDGVVFDAMLKRWVRDARA